MDRHNDANAYRLFQTAHKAIRLTLTRNISVADGAHSGEQNGHNEYPKHQRQCDNDKHRANKYPSCSHQWRQGRRGWFFGKKVFLDDQPCNRLG